MTVVEPLQFTDAQIHFTVAIRLALLSFTRFTGTHKVYSRFTQNLLKVVLRVTDVPRFNRLKVKDESIKIHMHKYLHCLLPSLFKMNRKIFFLSKNLEHLHTCITQYTCNPSS